MFTPEGERPWAGADWDPHYPGSAPSDEPGTVFTTQDGNHEVIWVIVSAGPDEKRYIRVTPGVMAGTVSVRCTPVSGQPHETQVEVTYELVALTEAARGYLADFARDYASFLADWPRQIRNAGLA